METQSTEPLSIDAAAAALATARETSGQRSPKEEEAAPPDYEPPEAAGDDGGVEAADASAEAEQEEVAEEAVSDEQDVDEAPPLEAPRSWSKEDREVWAKVPRDVQEIIARREADRDKAVNVAASQAGQINAALRDMASKYEALASGLQNDWQRRWGNVDWAKAARELAPEDYNAYRAQAEQEWQDYQAAEQERRRSSSAAQQAFLAEESRKLVELSPELADPDKGAERRRKTAEYLVRQGIGQDVLGDISALELTIAHKAMLWDEAQADAKRKASLPRKTTPQPAAKPVKPTGQGAVSPQRELQGLEARLTKAGRSGSINAAYDAAAELLAARRAQNQRGSR